LRIVVGARRQVHLDVGAGDARHRGGRQRGAREQEEGRSSGHSDLNFTRHLPNMIMSPSTSSCFSTRLSLTIVPLVEPRSFSTQTPASALISAWRDDMKESCRTIEHAGSLPIVVAGDSVNSSPRCGPCIGTIQPSSCMPPAAPPGELIMKACVF